MPKKPFFFKFTGLPYVYSVVMAHTKPSAQMEAALYRDDAVCFEQDALALSFKHYHEHRFTHKQIENIEQFENYKLKSAFDGEECVVTLKKNKLLESLIEHYYTPDGPPGVKSASIFTIGTKKAFGLKNSEKLKAWVIDKIGVEPLEMKQKQTFIPICFFSVTKEKVEERQEVKMLKNEKDVDIDYL